MAFFSGAIAFAMSALFWCPSLFGISTGQSLFGGSAFLVPEAFGKSYLLCDLITRIPTTLNNALQLTYDFRAQVVALQQ